MHDLLSQKKKIGWILSVQSLYKPVLNTVQRTEPPPELVENSAPHLHFHIKQKHMKQNIYSHIYKYRCLDCKNYHQLQLCTF